MIFKSYGVYAVYSNRRLPSLFGKHCESRPATRRLRRLVTNETAATGGVMHTDEGELEFDEEEIAALEDSV